MYIGIPQFILLFLMIVDCALKAAKHGQVRQPYDANEAMINLLVMLGMLYWCGIFTNAR